MSRERKLTTKGAEYELEMAIKHARRAIRMDNVHEMRYLHARLSKATSIETTQSLTDETYQILNIIEQRIYEKEFDQPEGPQESYKSQTHERRSYKSQSVTSSIEKQVKIKTTKLELQMLNAMEQLDKNALSAEKMAMEAKFRTAEIERLKQKVALEAKMKKEQMELDMLNEQFIDSDEEVKSEYEEKFEPRYHDHDNLGPKHCDDPEPKLDDDPSYMTKGFGSFQENLYRDRPSHSIHTHPRTPQSIRRTNFEDHHMTDFMSKAFDRLSIVQDIGVKFLGSPKDKHSFVTFMLKFKAAYGDKAGLSDQEKLIKLTECTAGDARSIVESCLLLGSVGYERAIQRLHERYGRPEEVVHSLMKTLTTGPPLSANDNFALVKLSDDVNSTIDILDKLAEDSGYETDYFSIAGSMDNIAKLLRRLPQNWRNVLIAKFDVVKLEEIGKYLTQKTRNMTSTLALACSAPVRGENQNPNPGVGKNRRVMTIRDENPDRCGFCETAGHKMCDCKVFVKISPQERIAFLRGEHSCFNCFGNHLASECQLKSQCQLSCKWKSKHSALLHNLKSRSATSGEAKSFATDVSPEAEPASGEGEDGVDARGDDMRENVELVSESEPEDFVSSTFNKGPAERNQPFFQVVPIVVTSPITGKSVQTFGCLDSMSTVHCADERLLEKLELDLPVTKTVISTITGSREMETRFSNLRIKGLYGSSSHHLHRVEFIPGNHLNRTRVPKPTDLDEYEHLKFIQSNFQPLELNQVSVLIGAAATDLHIAREVRVSDDPANPIAVKTDLGWCAFGGSELSYSSGSSCRINLVQKQSSSFDSSVLMEDLRQLWKIEANDLSSDCGLSVQDREALSILEESIRKTDSGHYEVSLLFKDDNPMFPDNRAQVERQLIQKKGRFIRDPEYLQKYTEQVNIYLSSGFARIVPRDKDPPNHGKSWYVPHHAVKHPRKESLRLVFNCSAKHREVSLNDKLYPGPDLINILVGVLVRFRTGGRFAVSADIKSMYHCVRVPSDQTSYLRWLWFEGNDPRGKVIELEMLVHLFGCLSSSACANFALRQCAIGEEDLISQQIHRGFYVDDYLASFESLEESQAAAAGVFRALKNGGFPLTKFCSTDKRILEAIPEEHCVVETENHDKLIVGDAGISSDQNFPEQVALGVRWDPNRDCIIFKALSLDLVCSKRGVLSAIARIVYDPCGLIVPVIVLPARLLFQELCRRQADWDSPLEDEEEKCFRKWYSRVADIGEVQIERCTRPAGDVISRELHFLSDASEKCFGSCCYMREVMESGEVVCTLLLAKSRLAPLRRSLTLVRLELQAAHTSILVHNLIRPQLDCHIDEVHYWTDSTAVLGYIANDEKRYQVFVANRIAHIREFSEVKNWHWIPTDQNTSDLMTRGLRDSEKFNSDHQWFQGPEFLRRRDRSRLPRNPSRGENLGE